MSSSSIKRKEAKPGGELDELSPFKRLRIYAPEKDKKEAEQTQKYKEQAERALRKQGQLKLSIYMNCGMLTINVMRARNLKSKWKTHCDSIVKISLIPDEQKRTKCKTKTFLDSNNPVYDDKFSFELLQEDVNKRLFISVWHIEQSNCLSDHLGCMSFGVLHLMKPNKRVEGWYHLLNEKTGPKKHLLVAGKQTPVLQRRVAFHRNYFDHQSPVFTKPRRLGIKNKFMERFEKANRGLHGIPLINKDLWGMEPLIISIERGKRGYGFSVIDTCPVRVSRVDGASPASTAGLKLDDKIVRVNGKNVSRSGSVSVAKLVKSCKQMITLDIQRAVSYEELEKSPWRPGMNPNQDDSDLSDLENNGPEHGKEVSVDDDGLLVSNDNIATSTPFPGSCDRKIFKLPNNMSHQKADAVQRLVNAESDYVSFMHSGIEQYSRPLRHCILSQKQHSTIFQNAEKLVILSEYHLKQLQFNAPSYSSTETDDTSQSDMDTPFIQSVGLIYQSKVHMLSQAYKLYAQGLTDANKTLQDLQRNPDFKKFLQESVSQTVKSSISAFIVRPSQHIKEIYQILREIFANTNRDASDYNNLKQIVEGLQLCVSYINNYTCMRALGLSSSSSRSSSSSQTSLSTSASGSSAGSSLVLGGSGSEIFPQASSATKPMQSTPADNDVFLRHKLQGGGRPSAFRRAQPSMSSIRSLRAPVHSHSSLLQSKPGRTSASPNCSEDSNHSVDSEVLNIQQKLNFPPGIPIFQLSQEERHLIYSGEMFKWDGDVWNKLQLLLFSDLLLQTEKTFDSMLTVVEAPVFLSCVQGIEMQRKHPTDFIIHLIDNDKNSGVRSKMLFRAPCIEQKYTWKSLIEQRILSNRSGNLESFVTSDISGASGVII